MLRSLFNRSSRVFGLAALALVLTAGSAFAQTGRIEGTVRDVESGDPIANARVTVVGTALAATTNQNGYFALESVPVGTHNVRVSVIGYQPVTITNQSVTSGVPTAVNFTLQRSILRIEGVVVTGVAEQTEAVKLPFTVAQLSGEDIQVPPQSAEEALRGKVAGVKVIRGSGRPGDGVSVLLRGATSINTSGRTNQPLYVVDGVILGESMVDIDALDIESIEVVKGAAASALYGARAANGVVSITTGRGRNLPEGETRITFKSEFGRNDLPHRIPQAQAHWYQRDAAGNWIMSKSGVDTLIGPNDRARATRACSDVPAGAPCAWRVKLHRDTGMTDWDGNGTFTTHTYVVADKPYTGVTTYDNLERFFDPGDFRTNTMGVSHRTGTTNFLASFHETREAGVVDGMEGYLRRGSRVNFDHRIGRQFDFSASGMYSQSESDDPSGNAGPFYSLNFYPIDVDLLELEAEPRDTNDFLIQPDATVVESNPIYSARNADEVQTRSRVLGNFRLRWRPVDEFDLAGDLSFDRSDRHQTNYTFAGFKDTDGSSNGNLTKQNWRDQAVNASLTAAFTKRFGDLNTVTKARALLERQAGEFFFAQARNFVVNDVKDLDVGDPSLENVGGSSDEIRSVGAFLSTQLDLSDRYIVDALIRRDGSSLFGADERWQTYYRLGGAYRMAEEAWWPVDFIDEFKLRYSRGTAGGRPNFSAQYETYNVSGGSVSKGSLGNRELKPEFALEQEFGVDMVLGGRVSLALTRALSTVEDQILSVPLAGYFGFSNQWRNAGTLDSKTWEGTLQAALIQRPDLSWSMNFVIDKTDQVITELNVPAYRINPGGAFYIREGEILGTMYGTKWATSCDDLFSASMGFWHRNGVAGCDQFQVNDDGYLVAIGSANSYQEGITNNYYGSNISINGQSYLWGLPIQSFDIVTQKSGQVDTTNFLRIGNTQPDVSWGLGNNVRFKGLTLYVLFDAQVGGDIYNNTRQWAAREYNAWEVDQSAKAEGDKKPLDYYGRLYFTNAVNSHYVEDGSYIKLRELAARYTIGRGPLENVLGGLVKRVTVGVVGRNLKTWTDYTGYDPEVSTAGGASAIYRFDGFGYPNYRTITGTVELEF